MILRRHAKQANKKPQRGLLRDDCPRLTWPPRLPFVQAIPSRNRDGGAWRVDKLVDGRFEPVPFGPLQRRMPDADGHTGGKTCGWAQPRKAVPSRRPATGGWVSVHGPKTQRPPE